MPYGTIQDFTGLYRINSGQNWTIQDYKGLYRDLQNTDLLKFEWATEWLTYQKHERLSPLKSGSFHTVALNQLHPSWLDTGWAYDNLISYGAVKVLMFSLAALKAKAEQWNRFSHPPTHQELLVGPHGYSRGQFCCQNTFCTRIWL